MHRTSEHIRLAPPKHENASRRATFSPSRSTAWLEAKEPPILLGLFEAQTDVGLVRPAGTGSFSAATGVYTLTAAGSKQLGAERSKFQEMIAAISRVMQDV